MMRCLIWVIYLMTQSHLRISCISSSNSSFPSCCDFYWMCHMPVPHGTKQLFLKVVSMVQEWPRDEQSHRCQKCKHRAISHPIRIPGSKDSLDHKIHVDKLYQTARKTTNSTSNRFFITNTLIISMLFLLWPGREAWAQAQQEAAAETEESHGIAVQGADCPGTVQASHTLMDCTRIWPANVTSLGQWSP